MFRCNTFEDNLCEIGLMVALLFSSEVRGEVGIDTTLSLKSG